MTLLAPEKPTLPERIAQFNQEVEGRRAFKRLKAMWLERHHAEEARRQMREAEDRQRQEAEAAERAALADQQAIAGLERGDVAGFVRFVGHSLNAEPEL